jgi:ribosome-binding factor A
VRRAVSLTLSGECGDPVLQALLVDEVLPAPNAGRMLVRVMVRAREQEAAGETLADILQRLAKVEGMLRARVGEMIARKRVPELVFEVIPVGAVRAESQKGEVSDG